MFDSITNRAEFFSDHYLNARLGADLKDLRDAWDTLATTYASSQEQPPAKRVAAVTP